MFARNTHRDGRAKERGFSCSMTTAVWAARSSTIVALQRGGGRVGSVSKLSRARMHTSTAGTRRAAHKDQTHADYGGGTDFQDPGRSDACADCPALASTPWAGSHAGRSAQEMVEAHARRVRADRLSHLLPSGARESAMRYHGPQPSRRKSRHRATSPWFAGGNARSYEQRLIPERKGPRAPRRKAATNEARRKRHLRE